MNIKQLLLTTALITSLSSIAIAEVSISGEVKVNARGGDYAIETDVFTKVDLGDNSIFTHIGVDNNYAVEQLYMTSKVAGINVKTGTFKTNKDELKSTVTKVNTTQLSIPFGTKPIDSYTDDIDSLSCHNGNSCFELVWQDFSGPGGEYAMIKGSLVGVKFLHKDTGWKKETKVLSNISGIDLAYHVKNYNSEYWGGVSTDASITLKTSVQGIDWTYVNTKSDNGTNMDGFIGKRTDRSVTKANAFGISTNIAGNKFTYKDIYIAGFDDQGMPSIAGDNSKQLIITRKLSSGATFEATYDNYSYDRTNTLDLELAFKF